MRTPPGFAALHVHTEYSLLDGLARVEEIPPLAAELGLSAVAITDHGTLAGAWKFAQAAKKAGIKPILGVEAYVAIGSRHDHHQAHVPADGEEPEAGRGRGKAKWNEHLTVLARTPAGWANLVAMCNAAQDSFWRKPRIDYDLLQAHGDGLIVLTGCLGGPVAGPLSRGDVDTARANLGRLIRCVGRDNVYVELMDHGITGERAALEPLVALARDHGLPTVATNDSHYLRADDAAAHDAWLAVQAGTAGKPVRLADATRFRFTGTGYHLRSEAQMRALRPEPWWQEACDNTVRLAARVADDVLPDPHPRLPRFDVPDGYDTARAYLVALVKDGARSRYGDPLPDAVRARLNREMKVIAGAGLVDYFLIVHDLIAWARSQGIRVGPGRGSAAGSCVSYCLGIVQVDPLRFDLLFERFLDPTRAGMPDIDVDFEKARRGEVLAYLARRYGQDRVARIGSYGVARTKAALNDAARLLDAKKVGDRLSALVPVTQGTPATFATLLDQANPAGVAFRDAVTALGPQAQAVLDLAATFEGVVKNASIHACGTVIADEPLHRLIPMRRDRSPGAGPGAPPVTEWDGKDVDAAGLLKLDVLGLRTLDVISVAIAAIRRTTGELLDPDALPDGDDASDARVARTWDLLAAGHTAGVFQLDGAGMTELCQKVRPTTMEHLAALVALYRPGPMAAGMHARYADRKNGTEGVDYAIFTTDPGEQDVIASVLGPTFGLTVFQEQALILGRVVAGFDDAATNRLRKAISKKTATEFAALGEMFVAGAERQVRDEAGGVVKRSFGRGTAERLWDTIKGSAAYSFNKSHAVAYAHLAYVTAYLKANWPAAFGAGTLAVTDGDDKRVAAIRALREEGIDVLAPDVNRSLARTSALDATTVILGLGEVKGVGSAAEHILTGRERNGAFTSLADLHARVRVPGRDGAGAQRLTATALDGLIGAGALDAFGPRLGQTMITRAVRAHPDLPVPAIEWGVLERASRQRARIGVSLSQHPLTVLRQQLTQWRVPMNADDPRVRGSKPVSLSGVPWTDGDTTLTLGLLTDWTESGYSRGRRATLRLEGSRESLDAVVWDDVLSRMHRNGSVPSVGFPVAVRGVVRVQEFDQDTDEGDPDGGGGTPPRRRTLTVQDLWMVPAYDPVRETSDGPPSLDGLAALLAPPPAAPATEPGPGPAPLPHTGTAQPDRVGGPGCEAELVAGDRVFDGQVAPRSESGQGRAGAVIPIGGARRSGTLADLTVFALPFGSTAGRARVLRPGARPPTQFARVAMAAVLPSLWRAGPGLYLLPGGADHDPLLIALHDTPTPPVVRDDDLSGHVPADARTPWLRLIPSGSDERETAVA